MALQEVAVAETYEAVFPRHLGPPPVKSYKGPHELEARKPTYTVELDAGAFRALWELVEGEAKHRFPTHRAMAGARAYLRAVEAFRKAYWMLNEVPAPPETPKPRKRLTRTSRR